MMPPWLPLLLFSCYFDVAAYFFRYAGCGTFAAVAPCRYAMALLFTARIDNICRHDATLRLSPLTLFQPAADV